VEVARVDHFVDALVDLLEPPSEQLVRRLDVFLLDPVPEAPRLTGNDDDQILRVMTPEGSFPPLPLALTGPLLTRWLGAAAASEELLVDGIAGWVAAQTDTGPPIEQLNELLRATMTDQAVDGPPSSEAAASTIPPEAVASASAASFIAFLLEAFGHRAFRQFVKSYVSHRRDQAAITAYQRPLGELQAAWQAGLVAPSRALSPWRSLFARLWPVLSPYRWRLAESFTYMLLSVAVTIALPLASRYLVDVVLPAREVRGLLIFIAILTMVYVFNAIVRVRGLYVGSSVHLRALVAMQEQTFRMLQRLPHAFYDRARIGDLMSRLSSDLGLVQQAMSQVIDTGVIMLLNAVAAAITIVLLSPMLGLLVLGAVPLVVLANRAFGRRLALAGYEQQQLAGETQSVLQENLTGHAVIKAFGAEDRAVSAFRARLASLFRASRRVVLVGGVFDASVTMATALPQIAVLGVGGYLVMDDELSLGTLVAFLGLLPSIMSPISSLADVGQAVQTSSGALERVNELLDAPVAIDDLPDAAALPQPQRSLELDHVSVGYSSDRPALFDVSLTIPIGTHAAIVGPSGAGKSTIVNLLLRFLDPDNGRVLFDDVDARDVRLASVRDKFGIVFQDTFVFNTTVRENIAVGRPDATDADIEAAARAAHLESFLESLPSGFDTLLGEGGGRLSGGQRQRLAIARAIVRDPPILIFDEATSNLDAQTERGILETVSALQAGRTTITVTHRLGLVANADRLFVLDRGRLVEEGTHDDLMTSGGLYQQLFEEQMGVRGARPSAPRADDRALLMSVPLFAGLDDRAIDELAARLVAERYGPGDPVIVQGEPGDRLCILISGSAEVLIHDGTGQHVVNVLGPGDFFGELALVHDEPRRATVRAATPTVIRSISKSDFYALASVAGFREAVAQVLTERMNAYGDFE
jgi:ATP-binding cassette subfamily B protein